MGLFTPKPVAATGTHATQGDSTAAADAEKVGQQQVEQGVNARPQFDAEAEKRLVRKLDWHIPPLVGFLCKIFLISKIFRKAETNLWTSHVVVS